MSVRVIARVRPLLKSEREVDVIVRPGTTAVKSRASCLLNEKYDKAASSKDNRDTTVRIPNPKNESEEYSFQFNAVYDAHVSQQELFDAEGS